MVAELQKEVNNKNWSFNELLTLITQIGEQYENKTIKENWERSKEEIKEKNKKEKKEECKIINSLDKDNENEEIKNKEKTSFNFPKVRLISEYLNILRNESVFKFSYHLLQVLKFHNLINTKYEVVLLFCFNSLTTK